ncbi:MAG: hypothetical protein GY741_10375, partial [Phycisphaeraceae bacterium]|nr:hypothetical protein [Phycisphaeraceae bacterium]
MAGTFGDAGDIRLSAPVGEVRIEGSPDGFEVDRIATSTYGSGRAGAIEVDARSIMIDGARLATISDIPVSSFVPNTFDTPTAFGSAGSIELSATESVDIRGTTGTDQGSLLEASSG